VGILDPSPYKFWVWCHPGKKCLVFFLLPISSSPTWSPTRAPVVDHRSISLFLFVEVIGFLYLHSLGRVLNSSFVVGLIPAKREFRVPILAGPFKYHDVVVLFMIVLFKRAFLPPR